MIRTGSANRAIACCIPLFLTAGLSAAQTAFIAQVQQGKVQPPAYGTTSWVITTIPATSFLPGDRSQLYYTSGSLGRYGTTNADQHFYAPVDLPAGAIVDYIGLNNLNDGTNAIMGVALWDRYYDGVNKLRAGLSSSPHTSWATDTNLFAYNWQVLPHDGIVQILDVEIAPSSALQYFGFVQIAWRRVVSPPPLTATFTDVPPGHIFFRFVEALRAAGITAGYSDGRFGVDDHITRGQMAVFLATALGLHWPG